MNLIARLCIPVALAFAVTVQAATPGTPLTDAEKKDLLARLDALKAKYPSLSARFTETRSSQLLREPAKSEGTLAFKTPNKFRREVGGTSPSLTVSNGKVLWLYYPQFKDAQLFTLGQRAMFDDAMAALTAGLNFGQVEHFYHLAAAHDTDGGYRITLTPKKSNLKRIVKQLVILLDRDLNVRRTDLTMPKGDEVVTHYTQTRRDPLPDSTFEFTPPPDATVTRPLGK